MFNSIVTATAENNDDSQDDDPGAVIVEKMAKTVVIHNMFLRRKFAMLHRLVTYYENEVEKVTPSFYMPPFIVVGV